MNNPLVINLSDFTIISKNESLEYQKLIQATITGNGWIVERLVILAELSIIKREDFVSNLVINLAQELTDIYNLPIDSKNKLSELFLQNHLDNILLDNEGYLLANEIGKYNLMEQVFTDLKGQILAAQEAISLIES
jgi:hypothetical protein